MFGLPTLIKINGKAFYAMSARDVREHRARRQREFEKAVRQPMDFSECKVPRKKPSRALYVLNWVSGGYNQVYARTKAEARREIARTFRDRQPDLTTLRRLSTEAEQEAYWKSIRD